MKTSTLAAVFALSDQDLLARIPALAGTERETTAELVAHLAALELRSSVYAAQGYGSLFAYCTDALHLSEDAACNRIEAARACRSFPVILDLLASGSLTLTSVRKLRKHLTPENHEAVLARARHQNKEQIDALVAELAPQPDVVSSVRKLPAPASSSAEGTGSNELPLVMANGPGLLAMAAPQERTLIQAALDSGPAREDAAAWPVASAAAAGSPRPSSATRPVLKPLAPGRYRVQFTIGQEGYDKLRRLQTLLRREVPNGDAGAIFERFVDVLLDKVEKDKLGKRGKPTASATTRRRSSERGRPASIADENAPSRAYENRIRSGADRAMSVDMVTTLARTDTCDTRSRDMVTGVQRPKPASRHIPNAVKRAVWFRDRGQCAFVADTGRRCSERSFLELHHIHPYALDGPATARNISLRCRRHNQYEAELVFGSRSRGSA